MQARGAGGAAGLEGGARWSRLAWSYLGARRGWPFVWVASFLPAVPGLGRWGGPGWAPSLPSVKALL